MIALFIILFLVFFFLGGAFLWLVTLIDILRSEFRDRNEKLLWGLLIVFLPIIGVILYWIIGRQKRVLQ